MSMTRRLFVTSTELDVIDVSGPGDRYRQLAPGRFRIHAQGDGCELSMYVDDNHIKPGTVVTVTVAPIDPDASK